MWALVFDEAGDINNGVDPQHEVDQVIIDIDDCKEMDDFTELDHLVDDIKNIVDLELESDKAAEELATISDEHHVREAGELLLHLVGCCNNCLPCFFYWLIFISIISDQDTNTNHVLDDEGRHIFPTSSYENLFDPGCKLNSDGVLNNGFFGGETWK